jgi:cytochrome c-type biogenesis protein CcmH/NrfG
MNTIRVLLGTMALAVLAACSSSMPVTRPETNGAPPPSAPPPTSEPTDPRAQTLATMLRDARDDRLAGNLVQAEATLESALRIAPGDARFWLELAETRLAAGDYAGARSFADRAMSLAGNNNRIRERALGIRNITAR